MRAVIPVGPFELERPIGRGAMAEVWAGVHVAQHVPVAVKVLHGERAVTAAYVAEFRREAERLASLDHPAIVTIFDHGTIAPETAEASGGLLVPGSPYLVMELCEGGSLARRGPLAWSEVVGIVRVLLDALAHAHARGVVHRDVKPENIFLTTKDGAPDFVKLLDFGVAKLLKPIGDLKLVGTKAGIVVGTPEYMAPEQAMGGKADARVDVYAVGLVMYELLAGVQPFVADNFGKLVIEITQSPVPPLPPKTPGGEPIPPGLAQVVLKCLEKDPGARFPSAAALADALEPFMKNGPVRPAAPKPVEIDEAELAAAVRPSRAPLITAILAVLILGAAVAWTFISPPGESETATGPKVTEPAPAAIPAPPAPAPVPADPAPKPSDPAPAAPETPAPPKSVWLDVKTKPVGAQVKRGDEVLGVTPLRLEVPQAEKASLSFVLANYADETREVALTGDVALSVDLKPVPKTKAKAPVTKKKKTGKKR